MNKISDSELDSLFAQTRHTEPYIEAGDFVDKVALQLPKKRSLPAGVRTLTDAVSAALGLAILVYFGSNVDVSSITQWLPQPLEISVTSIAITSLGLTLLSLVTWWSIEDR